MLILKKGSRRFARRFSNFDEGGAKIVQIQIVKRVFLEENAAARAKIVQNEEGNEKFYCAHVAPTPIRINSY